MEYKQTESGLVIATEKKPESHPSIRQQYDRLHARCPECGQDEIYRTCVGGYFGSSLESWVDENAATCRCGWHGIVHDLVPRQSGVEVTDDSRPWIAGDLERLAKSVGVTLEKGDEAIETRRAAIRRLAEQLLVYGIPTILRERES